MSRTNTGGCGVQGFCHVQLGLTYVYSHICNLCICYFVLSWTHIISTGGRGEQGAGQIQLGSRRQV